MLKPFARFSLILFLLLLNFTAAQAKDIYRSVGPGSTSPLAVGNPATISITGNTITVSADLPGRVGVGDVFQYDSNNDSTVDQVAFIKLRINARQYEVQNAAGGDPVLISGNVTTMQWAVFRAYTSLAYAALSMENTGIDPAVHDFDVGNNGQDLVANQWVWNLACYADAIDLASAVFTDWTTGPNNYIHIYTPVAPVEVGIPQRHAGKWTSSAYQLQSYNATGIRLNVTHARIDGLQFTANNVTSDNVSNVLLDSPANSAGYVISENLFAGVATAASHYAGVATTNSNTSLAMLHNNIFYQFTRTGSNSDVAAISARAAAGEVQAYNNTFVQCFMGINATTGTVKVINNLAQGCAAAFYGSFDPSSDYNVSDLATGTPGIHSKNGAVVQFVNPAALDFHLSPADLAARGAGINLSPDVMVDIDYQMRPDAAAALAWDVGADQTFIAPTPTFTPTLPVSATLSTTTPTQVPPYQHTPTPTSTQVLTGLATPTMIATRFLRLDAKTPWRLTNNVIRPGNPDGVGIHLYSEKAQTTVVKVFDQRGQWVCTLLDQMSGAGIVQLVWKGQDHAGHEVASGIYLVYIKLGNYEAKRKVAVIR